MRLSILLALLSWLVFVVVMVVLIGASRAQTHEGHSQYHHDYSNWKQPNGTSCCNARIYSLDGKTAVTGDCYATEAVLDKSGHWHAKLDAPDRLHWGVEWIEIPDERIIREKNPDDTGRAAHLCTSPYTFAPFVLCFVPPAGTM